MKSLEIKIGQTVKKIWHIIRQPLRAFFKDL